jgi:uncharacterized phage protein gp47/JayE
MATPTITIDATGVHVPDFATCVAYYQAQYRSVYGQDTYLAADGQDGQWLGILATSLFDSNAMGASVVNAFSPATAQGVGLSRVVKINGIARLVASYSNCDVLCVGQVGTVINNGAVADLAQNLWNLPPVVVIPNAGQILVTATAAALGAIKAAVGEISAIATPTAGWQSVYNNVEATPGAPVETDAQLRIRQAQSTMLASQGILDGILGALSAVPGVTEMRGYENDQNIPDVNGIPGHCIAIVIDGGDAIAIAGIIAARKSFAGTYGTTSIQVADTFGIGVIRTINFFRSTPVRVRWTLVVKAKAGFTTDIQAQIQQAIIDWTNARGIGNNLQYPRAFEPAQLLGQPASNTFELVSLAFARNDPGVPAAPTLPTDIVIAFNEDAYSTLNDIAIMVVA